MIFIHRMKVRKKKSQSTFDNHSDHKGAPRLFSSSMPSTKSVLIPDEKVGIPTCGDCERWSIWTAPSDERTPRTDPRPLRGPSRRGREGQSGRGGRGSCAIPPGSGCPSGTRCSPLLQHVVAECHAECHGTMSWHRVMGSVVTDA